MSSLIFHTDEEQVLVATDTLATSLEGEPFMFTSKAFILPHLQLLMCGTGMGGFLGKWFIEVNDRLVVNDIDHLNDHTPTTLSSIWHEYKKQFLIKEDITTTVYHFGFSKISGSIHSYAYRSESNFESEPFQYGIGIKPECKVPKAYNLPDDIKKMMDEQRAIQANNPKSQRIYIGGKILIYHLTNAGFHVYTHDKFDNYEESEKSIYRNFK